MSAKGECCTVDVDGIVDDAALWAEILGEDDLGALAKYSDAQPRDARGRFGSGNESKPSLASLFASSLGIARVDMPQIPNAMKPAFLAELRDAGVKVTPEHVDARSLKPTQGEFHEANVESVRRGLAEGTLKDNPITVSSDDRVLDGHHRWAVAAQDGEKIDTVRIDLPIHELMDRARDFGARHSIATQKFIGLILNDWDRLEKYSENQLRDDRGRFGSGSSDLGAHPPTPATRDYGAIRDSSGRTLGDLLSSGATRAEMNDHPAMVQAARDAGLVRTTDSYPGYGTAEFRDNRQFAGGMRGYDAASDHLMGVATKYAGEGSVKNEKQAWVILGLPASGKSTYAEKIAGARGAAIVDPDDAKQLFKEFGTGIGANAVHEESVLLSGSVLRRMTEVGANVILPKVGAGAGSIKSLTAALKEQGYTVHLGLRDADEEGAFRRAIGRFLKTGRLISGRYLVDVDSKPGKVYADLAGTGEYASTEKF